MQGSTVDFKDTTEWPVSTANTSLFNSTREADDNATVDEYAQHVIQKFQYVNLAVRLTMGLTAFSTNLFTIVAIASFEYLRTCTNYLIAYLAFADMVAGINAMLVVVNYLTPMSDYMWTRMCAIEQSLSWTTAGFNVLAILGISLDRYLFITLPFRYYTIMTNRVVVIYISLCVVLMTGIIAGVHCCGYNYLQDRICLAYVVNNVSHTNIVFYIFSLVILLPNIRIAYIAYQQKKAIARGQMFEVSVNQNKITKMLAMVLGIYYGCYVPQMLCLLILNNFFPGATYGIIIERITSWIWWVNSWSNPPIYAWKNKAFNKAFRSLLGMRSATVDPATCYSASAVTDTPIPGEGTGPIMQLLTL